MLETKTVSEIINHKKSKDLSIRGQKKERKLVV